MTIADKLIEKGEKRGIEKGEKRGIEKGKLEGMKLGEYLKAKETAKELLKAKVDRNIISKAIGLTLEQIKKIEEEMNQNKN
jgi:predicted transposase YdaD